MEPDPDAQLMTVLDAVAARAEDARRRLDELAARLDEREPARPSPADPVRLAAIELAVSGADRAQTASSLRRSFPSADHDAVLDDVFGT
jgi:hypothetical protein